MGLENPLHIAILLLVVLMVFGAKRLPEMGKSMGQGMRGFKDALTGNEAAANLQLATTAVEPSEPQAEPATASSAASSSHRDPAA